MRKIDKTLGKILLEKHLISLEQLNEALEEQKKSKEFLGRILLKKGYIKEENLIKALSEQFNMEIVDLKYQYLDNNFLNKFSPTLIFDLRCFPLRQDKETIIFVIANPLDVWAIKKAEEAAGNLKAKFVLASESGIDDALLRYKEYLKNQILKRV